MKDIVFLVVDSLMSDRVFSKEYGKSTTPFLDSIRNECIFANNVYAQGPFTEAGTKGLLTGRDTLEDEGYFLRYHKSKTFITNIFKDVGFETYSLIYPTCLYSNWIFDKIDKVYYTSGMLFDVFWEQKFIHYADYYKRGKFDERDMNDCIELFDVIFFAWIKFLEPQSEENRVLLSRFDRNYDYNKHFGIINEEYNKFKTDKKEYVKQYLSVAPKHPLNCVKSEFTKEFICHKEINEALTEHRAFQRMLRHKQFWYNAINNRLTFNNIFSMLKRIGRGMNKYSFGELVYYIKTLTRGIDLKRYKDGDDYKPILSAKTQIDQILNILDQPSKLPKFVTAHLEEPHYFTTFFSFDSKSKELISKELNYAYDYVKSINRNYRGLITYDLSVRYIDKQIEGLVKSLGESGKLDNTIICITADHGSSYNCYPYRNRIVNNCHTENFRIPFILYDKGQQGKTIDYIATSKDIIPTIIDFIGSEYQEYVTGKSLLQGSWENECALTEYMGPGCPDMRRNKACITIRNKHYIIAYEGWLQDEFDEKNITEIYDILSDCLEVRNIKFLRNAEISDMILLLQKRYNQIRENNKDWLSVGLI